MKSFYEFCLLREQPVQNQATQNNQQQQAVPAGQQQQPAGQQQQQQPAGQQQQKPQAAPQVDINQLNNTLGLLKKLLLPLGAKF
jgi:hypothetical protein